MVNKKTLVVRLTKNQHERIKNLAEAKGFKNVSHFVRETLLGRDMVFDEKFNRLYEKIMNNPENSSDSL